MKDAVDLLGERITELEAKLKAAELDAHTKDAFYGEKFAAQEIKLKAANAENLRLLKWQRNVIWLIKCVQRDGDVGPYIEHYSSDDEWFADVDALLAQEGGDK